MSPYVLKCVLVGDPYIDSWNLLTRYLNTPFLSECKDTLGCDFGVIKIPLDTEHVTLQVWDVACNNRFQFIRRSFFRGANCAVIAFDLTVPQSFDPRIPDLLDEILSNVGHIPVILLGCNADLEDQRQVSIEHIDQFCESRANVTYTEFSSLNPIITSVLVEATFHGLENIGHPMDSSRLNLDNMDEILKKVRANAESKRKRFKELVSSLEELDFSVKRNSQVEIVTHRGLFSVELKRGQVYFEPLNCSSCQTSWCRNQHRVRRKSLCIVSGGSGWSNVGLENQELLIIAKILAIADDRLPAHVINQIQEICPKPARNLNKLADLTIPTDIQITPVEAQALLRNYKIQYSSGNLPRSHYFALKERYEKFIDSSF